MRVELKILNKEYYPFELGHAKNKGYPSLPEYATSGSAGVDLRATRDYTIYPGETVDIPTGLAIHISSAFPYCGFTNLLMGMIVPRSGLGSRGLILANTIGIIDQDYQGEIIIKAWNRNKICELIEQNGKSHIDFTLVGTPVEIKPGDRIAQLIFVPVIKAQWIVVDEFTTKTERGTGGFNSSGR